MAKKKQNRSAGKAEKKNEIQKNSQNQETAAKRNHQKVNTDSISSLNSSKPVRENNYSGSGLDHSVKTNVGKADPPLMQPVTGIDFHTGSVNDQGYTENNYRSGSLAEEVHSDHPQSQNSGHPVPISQNGRDRKRIPSGGQYNILSSDRQTSWSDESIPYPRTEEEKRDSDISPYDRQGGSNRPSDSGNGSPVENQGTGGDSLSGSHVRKDTVDRWKERNSYQNENKQLESPVEKKETSGFRVNQYDSEKIYQPVDNIQKRQRMRQDRENPYSEKGNLHVEHPLTEENRKYSENHVTQYHPEDSKNVSSGDKPKGQIEKNEDSRLLDGARQGEKSTVTISSYKDGNSRNPHYEEVNQSRKSVLNDSGRKGHFVSIEGHQRETLSPNNQKKLDYSEQKKESGIDTSSVENSGFNPQRKEESLIVSGDEKHGISNDFCPKESGIHSDVHGITPCVLSKVGKKDFATPYSSRAGKTQDEIMEKQILDGLRKQDDSSSENRRSTLVSTESDRGLGKDPGSVLKESGIRPEIQGLEAGKLDNPGQKSDSWLPEPHPDRSEKTWDETVRNQILNGFGKKEGSATLTDERRETLTDVPIGHLAEKQSFSEKLHGKVDKPDEILVQGSERKQPKEENLAGTVEISSVARDAEYQQEVHKREASVERDESMKNQILDDMKKNPGERNDQSRRSLLSSADTDRHRPDNFPAGGPKYDAPQYEAGKSPDVPTFTESGNKTISVPGRENRKSESYVHPYEEEQNSLVSNAKSQDEQMKDQILDNMGKKTKDVSPVDEKRNNLRGENLAETPSVERNKPFQEEFKKSDESVSHLVKSDSPEDLKKDPLHENKVVSGKQGMSENQYQEIQEGNATVQKRDQEMKEQILDTASRQAGSQNLSDISLNDRTHMSLNSHPEKDVHPENQAQGRKDLGVQAAPVQDFNETIPPNGAYSGTVQEEMVYESLANGRDTSNREDFPEKGSIHTAKDRYGMSELHPQSNPVPGKRDASPREKMSEKVVLSSEGNDRDERVKEEILNRARNTSEERISPVRQDTVRPQSPVDVRDPKVKLEGNDFSGQKSGSLQEKKVEVSAPVKNQKPEEIPNPLNGKPEDTDIKDEILKRAQNREAEDIVSSRESLGHGNLPEGSVTPSGKLQKNSTLSEQVRKFVSEGQQVSISSIQKKFQVDAAQAAKILKQLENQGILSEKIGHMKDSYSESEPHPSPIPAAPASRENHPLLRKDEETANDLLAKEKSQEKQVREILTRAKNTSEESMTPVRQNPGISSSDGKNIKEGLTTHESDSLNRIEKSGGSQKTGVSEPVVRQGVEEHPDSLNGKPGDIKDEILKRAQSQETEEIISSREFVGHGNLPEDNGFFVSGSIKKDDLFKQVGQFVTKNQKVSVLDESVKDDILKRAAQTEHSEEITALRHGQLGKIESPVLTENRKPEEHSDLLNENPEITKDEILKRAQNQEKEEIVDTKESIGHENGANGIPEMLEENAVSEQVGKPASEGQQVSISDIQQKFQVDAAQAAQILKQLERHGIVSAGTNSGKVLIDLENIPENPVSRDETVKDEILNRAAHADQSEDLVGEKRGFIHTDEDQKDDLPDSGKVINSDDQMDSDETSDKPELEEESGEFPVDTPPDILDNPNEIVDASEKVPSDGKRPKLSVSAAAVIAGAARKLKFDDGDALNPFSRFNSGKFSEDEKNSVDDSSPTPSGYFNPDDPDAMEGENSSSAETSKEESDATEESSEKSEWVFDPEDPVSPEDILEDLSRYQPSDVTFKLSSRMEITARQFTGHFYRMAAKGDSTKKEFDEIVSGGTTAALIIADRMKKFAAKGQQNLMVDRLNGTLQRVGLNPLAYVPRNVADLNLIIKDLNRILVKNGYKPMHGPGTRIQIMIGKMLRHGGLNKEVEDALKAMQEVAKNKTLLEGHRGMRNVTRMVKMKARMYLQQCEMGRGLFFITDAGKYTKDLMVMIFRITRVGAQTGRMASRLALKKSLQAAVKLSKLNSSSRVARKVSQTAQSYAKNASEFSKKQQMKHQKKMEKKTKLEQKVRDPFGLRAKRYQWKQNIKTKIMNRIPNKVKNNKVVKLLSKVRDKMASLFSAISTLFAALKHYLFLGLLIFILFAAVYAVVDVLITSVVGIFDANSIDEDIRVKILEQIQTCYNEQLEYIEGLNSQYDEVHVVFNDVKDVEKYEDEDRMPHEAFLETTNSAEILSMALVYFDYDLEAANEAEVLSYVRQLYNGSHQLTVQSNSEIIGFDEDTEESIEWTTAEVTLTTYYFDSIFDSMLSDSSTNNPALKGGSVEYQVWYYFRKLGFSEETVAGILENAQQESSMDPYNNDPWAIGLFQFETGYKETPPFPPDFPAQILKKMAAERSVEWTNLQVQLDCVMSMLPSDFKTYTGKTYTYGNGTVTCWPEKMTLDEFKVIDDVSLATQIFCRVHERPSKPQMNNRISYAQSFYKKFKGTNVDGSEIIDEAMKYIGCPYVWSGGHKEGLTDYDLTKGADCSGFVYWVLKKTGYYDGTSCPISDNFASLGEPVGSIEEAMPGDVIVWKGHVGFYMGNDEVIHAANPDAGIKTTKGVNAAGGGKKLLGIRRFHKIQ